MNNAQHPVNKLMRHAKKNGTKGFLPQNLTEDLLKRMILEAEAIEKGATKETPSSTLLLSILHLADPTADLKKTVEVKVEPDLLMEYFDLYITAIKVEAARRTKEIVLSKSSLPTTKNIFDKNRKIEIIR